jgi:aminomethyltransferase
MLRTPLHDLHIERGARMVPFAGYEMPVQYAAGVLREHLHTRASAGLFDVSHMGQLIVRGPGATAALERLVPADLVALPVGRQVYSLLMNDAGGIRDDLIITRWGPEEFFVVVNAGCKQQDVIHLRAHLGPVGLIELGDRALLALQGPRAAELIASLAPEAGSLVFMNGMHTPVAGIPCFVTRSGYTGEDGFEMSVPAARAVELATALLAIDGVLPIGLGARDSLRLEAGLCLYGHDLDEQTTPVEAGLGWALAKARRPGGVREGGYPGAARIADQLANGVSRRRIGLLGEGKAPVREGAVLLGESGQQVGTVCSGGFGPSADAAIAMAYVDHGASAPDTLLQAIVRDKPRPMRVVKLPFVAQRYYRGS